MNHYRNQRPRAEPVTRLFMRAGHGQGFPDRKPNGPDRDGLKKKMPNTGGPNGRGHAHLTPLDIGNVYVGMVNDAFQGSTAFNATHHGHEYGNVDGSGYYVQEEPIHEAKKFYDMLDAANTPIYEGCRPGQSKLSLATRFMNLKVDNNMSESAVDGWAELFREYLPKGNQATGSYYET